MLDDGEWAGEGLEVRLRASVLYCHVFSNINVVSGASNSKRTGADEYHSLRPLVAFVREIREVIKDQEAAVRAPFKTPYYTALTFAVSFFSFIILTHVNPPIALGKSGGCSNAFPFTANGATQNLLYCTNKSIDTPDDTVRRLIVIVHGNRRNANSYYNYIMSAARTAGAMDSLIIAPHFAIQSDISATDVLYWSSGGWKIGDESQSSVKISSYAVVDEIIKYVSDRTKFPNLRKVIVTGHSAGGQFVNRYSAGTQIEREQKSLGNSYRYIIANPSSYLYFTPDRGVSHTIDQFSVDGAINCPTYDIYKYGLKNMNAYMINTGAEKIAAQYKDRNVIYLLGDQDTNSNGSNLDESCAGDAQGANRFERGKIYYNYIGHVYGPSVYAKHILAVVPGVGHSADEMYNSENGRKYLFER